MMSSIVNLQGEYVLGVDVSHWQGAWDAKVACQAGARFAFIRATAANAANGAPYRDTRFEHNARSAVDAGLLVTFYHYFRPQFNVLRQAQYFCQAASGKPRHFPLVVDVEEHGALAREAMADSLHLSCAHEEAESRQKPMIYTGASFWNRYVGNPIWAGEHLLWVALWSDKLRAPWASAASEQRPLPWQEWAFWQKSADGNGRGKEFGARSKDICLDVFNGSYEDLVSLSRRTMRLGAPPVPAEVPSDALERLWRFAVREGWEV